MKAQQNPTTNWWLLWILSTVAVPGISFMALQPKNMPKVAFGVLALNLLLHAIASFKLSTASGAMRILLFLGGYVLMVTSFFVGCLAAIGKAL